MSSIRFRVVILTSLFLAPVLFLLGSGMYFLWQQNWSFYAWWPMAGCFFLAMFLAWYWTRRTPKTHLPNPDEVEEVSPHWTPQDKQAWQLVQDYVQDVPPLSKETLSDMTRYAKDGQALAVIVSKHYHPNAKDPFGPLTIPEILTAMELVAQDLSVMVEKYVPVGHHMTIQGYRQLYQVADWYKRGRDLYWMASIAMNPLKAGVQFLVSKYGLQSTYQQVEKNMIQWFYMTFLNEMGKYLIELNSGRLRLGSRRYRELVSQRIAKEEAEAAEASIPTDEPLRILLFSMSATEMKQLLMAFLAVSSVPVVSRKRSRHWWEHSMTYCGQSLLLIEIQEPDQHDDIAKYIEENEESFFELDMLILQCPIEVQVKHPAYQWINAIEQLYVNHPEIHTPALLLGLTGIEHLLSDVAFHEPEDWREGEDDISVALRSEVARLHALFGAVATRIIPLAIEHEPHWGITQELLPALQNNFDAARSIQRMRLLRNQANQGSASKILGQVGNAAKTIVSNFFRRSPKS